MKRVKIKKMRKNNKKKSLFQFTKHATSDPRFRRNISKSLAAKTMEKMFTAMVKKAEETCASTSSPTRWEPTTNPPPLRSKLLNGMKN